jgi:nucleoside-diphosphate-sugar epimerase
MKIFITGSSGFLGKNLTRVLEPYFELHHMKADLRDHSDVEKELLSADPDMILHMAARTEVQKSFVEQISFSEINYVGTINLIESASKLKNLKNFVFASTMEVYGWHPISDEVKINGKPKNFVLFDENTPTNPNCPYAVAKLGCENYLQYAGRSYGLPFTIIRQTNAYGRNDNDYFVTEQIITQMLKNKNSINLGYAEPYRNFIYVSDMMDMYKAVIENYQKCIGKTFTIGPDKAVKIKDYAEIIAQKLNWSGQILWNKKDPRPGEIYWLCSNNKLINETIGWEPKVSLSDGLDQTIKIWQNILND